MVYKKGGEHILLLISIVMN